MDLVEIYLEKNKWESDLLPTYRPGKITFVSTKGLNNDRIDYRTARNVN